MCSSLEAVEEALCTGKIALLIDDLDSRIRGHLFLAAEHANEALVNRLIALSRGVVTAPVSEERLRELHLHPAQHNQESLALAVEARFGVSTGVSAADRAQTLCTLAKSSRPRTDLVIPGHIFPYLSMSGGVLVRAGASEAAVDLLKRAGCSPVAAMAHCLDDSGESLDLQALNTLAQAEAIPVVHISHLLTHRLANESLVEQVTDTKLPLDGMEEFGAVPFRSRIDGAEHLALIRGDLSDTTSPPLVRVQSEERISDLFGFGHKESRSIIRKSLACIDKEQRGVLVYIRHPRRSIVAKKVKELASAEESSASRAGELREYGVGTQILQQLGIRSLRLLTTKKRPMKGIENFQIEVVSQVLL